MTLNELKKVKKNLIRIEEFAVSDEGLSIEEIKDDLMNEGINPDGLLKSGIKLIRKCLDNLKKARYINDTRRDKKSNRRKRL